MNCLAVLTSALQPLQPLQRSAPRRRQIAARLGLACALFAAALGAHAATVVKFATGASNSAAILSDGSLWTWGNNMNGQLGNGTSTNANKPVSIGTGFTQVQVGSRYMVALKADGSLWMWGHAVLRDREFYETVPVQIGSGFDKLLTSDTAAKADGTVWFWGDSKLIYSAPAGGNNGSLDQLPAGYWQMATGPYNALFVLGGGAMRYVSNNNLLNTWRTAYGSNGPAGSGFAQVALNATTAAGVKTDGTLWQWKGEEQPASLGAGYGQVAKGTSHTVALKTDGSVWAWGSNANGQLGVDSAADVDSPQLVGNGYTAIAAAAQHTLALKSDGTLMAWGSNSVGQLGTGAAGATPVQPTAVVFGGTSPGPLGEVTVTGPIELRTLTVRVQIASEHLASGVQGDVYLMVFGPDGSAYFYNGYGFPHVTPFGLPQPWINGLENRTTVLISNQDLRALRGTKLYVGYGLKSSKHSDTMQEMLASKRYQLVYSFP
ncbi:hypothetical protein HNP48_006336 [Acidovorax soli]|uniref:Alpha-tubulin suppressor n=1 Tax=Acidovorax soli TaxID=592050 RepID=A0A7X0UCN6_9BURK|nr:hypothetical protein [Acidovorax soli]MBB6563612.1 hypothetical protein [Acidovorax soli]